MSDSILEGCKSLSPLSPKKQKKFDHKEAKVLSVSKDPKVRKKAAAIDPLKKGRTFSQSRLRVGDSTASKITRPSSNLS